MTILSSPHPLITQATLIGFIALGVATSILVSAPLGGLIAVAGIVLAHGYDHEES